ncbi:MAG: radical SAM protein [Clostridiales bacterium]|nr:radical SAM protein [Clostridiales bacterium]
MTSITKLLTRENYFGDGLRYSQGSAHSIRGVSDKAGPVVVWNCTKTCNLSCVHCYSESQCKTYDNELTFEEACALIDDLAMYRCPVLLFSGGEPLMRPDLLDLARRASEKGIRPTISTNGTLIDMAMAKALKDTGVGYVGISLDGLEETNDRLRGKRGAFQLALEGIRNCVKVGQRVGLRFTVSKHNYTEVDGIFDLLERENIDRVCFYHLVYAGRGNLMIEQDISHEQTRSLLDTIIRRTLLLEERGQKKEILTVDNHADGVYVYLKTQSPYVLDMLRRNGGNRSGIAFACVDSEGNVHADQFTRQTSFGNVKDHPFSEIWSNPSHPMLQGLRNRKPLLKGRCAACRYLDLCNGNFRSRAESVTGDFWASDPACYLTDAEIGLEGHTKS